jgi:hypothetical protein
MVVMFQSDPKTMLQRALDAAVRYAESAARPERDGVRKLLLDAIERLRFVEVLAADRKPSDMVTLDGPEVRVRSEPPVRANLKNSLRDLILGRS